jgi:ABC-type glycerol-3-phosphate transport system permease component
MAARAPLGRSVAAHAVLIAYTLIALFPVWIILINSFKSRRAIFGDPLRCRCRAPGTSWATPRCSPTATSPATS